MIKWPRALGRPRKWFISMSFIILTMFSVILLTYYYDVVHEQLLGKYRIDLKQYQQGGGGLHKDQYCKFPLLNPFDKTILKHVTFPAELNCSQIQPYLTDINDDGEITINATEYKQISENSGEINCTYRELDRNGTDDAISKTKLMPLRLGIPVKFSTDVVEVFCEQNNTTIYKNIHAYPRNTKRKLKKSDELHLSVTMMVFDSMGQNTFERQLPKTYKYLTETMGTFVFRGFHKVGENTFPNIIPMLTGKRINKAQPDMPDEFKGTNYRTVYWDKIDLIWKQFAKLHDYHTAFIADCPELGLFNHLLKGFNNTPVDWYFRPYFNARRWLPLKNSTEGCYGNVPKYKTQLDIAAHVQQKCAFSRCFMFNLLTEMSHSSCCFIQQVDHVIKNYFQRIYEQGFLNRTILFVLGDHGLRYGPVRDTSVGLIEERLPMMSIRLPHWFLTKYPHIKTAIVENQWRLASTFDIHETFLDILNVNYDGSQRKEGTRGLSLLYPLPLNRTCPSAGIPDHFCTCTLPETIDIASDLYVKSAAEFIVQHINTLLIPVADQCVSLTLKSIQHAELFTVNQKVLYGTRLFGQYKDGSKKKSSAIRQYRLTIKTDPNDAIFEALVQINTQSNDMTSPNDISRINKYGNQSSCIREPTLRKYCYCINKRDRS